MEGFTYFLTYDETQPTKRKQNFWKLPCSMGADLSQGDDFCAFTFMFPLRNGCFGIKTRSYITSRTMNRLPLAMRTKYEDFMREGSLIVLEGTVLDLDVVYDDIDKHIVDNDYDVRAFGYDPYNASTFVDRWSQENSPYGVVKVIQGAKTESVPLGEIKQYAEDSALLFDQEAMKFAMGNCIVIEDTNGNRKLAKPRHDKKIDPVAAMLDAYVAYKENKDSFE